MDVYAFVELLDEMRGIDTDHEDYDYDIQSIEEWLDENYGMSLEQAQDFLSKVIHYTPTVQSGLGSDLFKGFSVERNGMGRFLEKIKVG